MNAAKTAPGASRIPATSASTRRCCRWPTCRACGSSPDCPRPPPIQGRALLTRPFAEALAEAEKIIADAPHVKSERDLAEGLDYLAGSIQGSLRLAWAYQRDFPYFVQSTGPYTKMGLDNPDTLYFHAYLRDDAEYVVTGRRGSTADLSFQVLKGDYTPAEVPDSLSAFDDRAIDVADDGAFEFRLGPGPAGPRSEERRVGK